MRILFELRQSELVGHKHWQIQRWGAWSASAMDRYTVPKKRKMIEADAGVAGTQRESTGDKQLAEITNAKQDGKGAPSPSGKVVKSASERAGSCVLFSRICSLDIVFCLGFPKFCFVWLDAAGFVARAGMIVLFCLNPLELSFRFGYCYPICLYLNFVMFPSLSIVLSSRSGISFPHSSSLLNFFQLRGSHFSSLEFPEFSL